MPIRPELRHHYGVTWQGTRQAILLRAHGHCEQCGKPDRALVWVLRDDSGRWALDTAAVESRPHDLTTAAGFVEGWRDREGRPTTAPCGATAHLIQVVLTVAHLNHTPGDDRPENLRALCQGCHLRHDRDEHKRSRRLARTERVGQLRLRLTYSAPDARG